MGQLGILNFKVLRASILIQFQHLNNTGTSTLTQAHLWYFNNFKTLKLPLLKSLELWLIGNFEIQQLWLDLLNFR